MLIVKIHLLNRVPEHDCPTFSCCTERNVNPHILNGSISQTFSCYTEGHLNQKSKLSMQHMQQRVNAVYYGYSDFCSRSPQKRKLTTSLMTNYGHFWGGIKNAFWMGCFRGGGGGSQIVQCTICDGEREREAVCAQIVQWTF